MSYPPDSAGGLMVTEYLVYPARTTAGRVVEDISSGTRDLSRHLLQHAFVTDRAGRLLGIVRFRDLVFALPETRLREIMSRPIVINAGADLDVMRGCFDEVGFMALPVTADQGVLCGVLLRSDVDEALAAKAAEDHLKSQGILGGEELRTMPVALRSRRRLSWLSVNIFLNMIAASVIAAFEETLTAVVALAVFLPIVSDMSGCSGNQAVAVSMRELTLGIAGVRDSFRVWWQEIKVGVINGLVLGMLLAVAAWAWRGSPVLGLIVGAALSVNTLVAVSIGGTVPLLLKRFGADPAVASGPVLTTVTDMCGFFLVLGIATILLPWI
jgi:magnesium transporter